MVPFYPTNKKARWLQVSGTCGCLQQPEAVPKDPLLWLWDIPGARHGRKAASSLSPVWNLVITVWRPVRRTQAGSAAELLASLCSCDQLWLHVPHRLLAVPSSPVLLPSQQDLGEIYLVGTEMMVEGRKKSIREEIGTRGKSGSVMPHWGRNHLSGLQNGSSLSLGKAIILQKLTGQLP